MEIHREGSASAACAAGLFYHGDNKGNFPLSSVVQYPYYDEAREQRARSYIPKSCLNMDSRGKSSVSTIFVKHDLRLKPCLV